MCDFNSFNLIDLNLDDEVSVSNTKSKTVTEVKLPAESSHFVATTWRNHDSLENNPFDRVHNLANRLDDPFDIVEKECHLKSHTACTEVKLGNLLSLSDDNLLDFESPPVGLKEKQLQDSISGPDTDSTPNNSSETLNSTKLKKNMEYRKKLLKLSISNAAYSSPVSTMFSRAAEFGEHSLGAESPLKLVEDEESAQEERRKIIDSEKKFEADLEMLKIPILNDLPSPAAEQILFKSTENSPPVCNNVPDRFENALPNLEAIKNKLKSKKEEISNNCQLEISSLIENLRTLILSGKMEDKNKQQKASDLLESLSSALNLSNIKEKHKASRTLEVPPQTIKRQGTFDMDLQDNQETVDNQPLVQDMPNCMLSSSATYDGETPNDKDLILPEIDPLPPQEMPSPTSYHFQSDVNNIMEQLSKLLINNSADSHKNCDNPTFIVVMNTSQLNHSNQSAVEDKLKSAFIANYLENSLNDGSPDLTKVNPITRRRSQSLSIHDKVKIVRLSLQPDTLNSTQKLNSVVLEESLPISTTPPNDREVPQFKTPIRSRCSSYSSGTPYTTEALMRRRGFGSESKKPTKMRTTQTVDTHHENQQQNTVRTMSKPSNNFLSFKPDLKKKTKHSTESIINSSAPLKATLPVKTVAPMLKTSPPTPERITKSKIGMPTTPFPAQIRLGEGVGYPKACSTPAAFSSALKRTTGPVNKPRYSYIPATANYKSPVTNSATSAILKRRTIAEFKSKSPLKPRGSNAGLQATGSTSSTRASAGNSRLSVSVGAKISKTPVKISTVNTGAVKRTSGISSRSFVGGSSLPTRNKENNRP